MSGEASGVQTLRRPLFPIETNGGMVLTDKHSFLQRARHFAPATLAVVTVSVLLTLALQTKSATLWLGEESDVVPTVSADPLVIAQNSAFVPQADDFVELTKNSGRLLNILIHRKFPVTVVADGRSVVVRTYGASVGALLEQAGVEIREGDAANLPFDAQLTDEAEIRLTRMRRETEVVETSLPFQVQRVASTAVPEGTFSERTAGEDGVLRTIRENRYLGDTLVESVVLSEEVVKEPVTAVVAYGVGGTVATSRSAATRYSYVLDMTATAYTYGESGHWGDVTASGKAVQVGYVAVDPRVIPLGSRLYITYPDGSECYGFAVAEDTGGAIKGNRIDLFFETYDEAISFGRRKVTVYVLAD